MWRLNEKTERYAKRFDPSKVRNQSHHEADRSADFYQC